MAGLQELTPTHNNYCEQILEQLGEVEQTSAKSTELVVNALFGNARIEGHDVNILIDTGSVGSIIIKRFLQTINRDIDGPITTKIIDVMKRQSAPLGMVMQLKINVNGITIPEDAIVTEALGYNVLLGNS